MGRQELNFRTMQYRFTKDLPPTRYVKDDPVNDDITDLGLFEIAILLHLGIIEPVEEAKKITFDEATGKYLNDKGEPYLTEDEWKKTSLEEWTKPWPQEKN